MEIELSHVRPLALPVKGLIRLGDEPAGDLAVGAVRFPEPIDFDGTIRRDGETFVLEGRVAGSAALSCARCLAEVVRPFDLAFNARFAPHASAPAGKAPGDAAKHLVGADTRWPKVDLAAALDDAGGILLDKDDMDVSFLPAGARFLLVDDVVREQVLLDLPLRALCREDCKGLCPRCGADLNEDPCGCGSGSGPTDVRLAALAEIRRKLEKN